MSGGESIRLETNVETPQDCASRCQNLQPVGSCLGGTFYPWLKTCALTLKPANLQAVTTLPATNATNPAYVLYQRTGGPITFGRCINPYTTKMQTANIQTCFTACQNAIPPNCGGMSENVPGCKRCNAVTFDSGNNLCTLHFDAVNDIQCG